MHPRAELRAAVRAALKGSEAFGEFTILRAWSRDIDPTHLPCVLVATPSEPNRYVSGDQVNRETELRISIRRQGGDDLDDILDTDSADLEALILPILAERSATYGLQQTEIAVHAEGSPRIGKLDMAFSLTRYTREGEAT